MSLEIRSHAMVSSERSGQGFQGALHPELPKELRPAGMAPRALPERTSPSERQVTGSRGHAL